MMIPLIVQIIAPIFMGLFAYIFKKSWMRGAILPLQLVLLFGAVNNIFYVSAHGEYIKLLSDYALPIGMSLRLDTLAAIMILLNNLLFFVTTIYDLKQPYNKALFIFLFVSLQGLINGVFLSNDLFNIYIIIEVSTIVVSVLIMFKKDAGAMYNGMFYLMLNIVSMAFFIVGVGYVYKQFGVFDYPGILERLPLVSNRRSLILPVAFLLTGVSLKSAIMPVFSWLPKAHGTKSAPAVVSAVLSGVFVKSGLYLIIRITQTFSPYIDLRYFLLFAAFVTAVTGFIVALGQRDIKLILSYHTISQIGLILFGVSMGTEMSYEGAIYHIFNHGVFKALLFLIANELIRLYGTLDITQMHGLLKRSKYLSCILIIAVLSITGAPLFSGGYSKMIIKSGAEATYLVYAMQFLALGTMLSFTKFIKVLFGDYNGQAEHTVTYGYEIFGMGILASVCIFLGVFGQQIMQQFFGHTYYAASYHITEKIVEYIAYFTIAFLVYRVGIKNNKWLKKLERFDVTFNSAVLTLVLYFMALLSYMSVTVS